MLYKLAIYYKREKGGTRIFRKGRAHKLFNIRKMITTLNVHTFFDVLIVVIDQGRLLRLIYIKCYDKGLHILFFRNTFLVDAARFIVHLLLVLTLPSYLERIFFRFYVYISLFNLFIFVS